MNLEICETEALLDLLRPLGVSGDLRRRQGETGSSLDSMEDGILGDVLGGSGQSSIGVA